VLDKNTRNHKASSSRLEPAALDSADELTEPYIGKDSPVGRPVGRHLKRSNAIGLITIPSQAEKRSQNKHKDGYEPEVAEPASEPGADWEIVDDEIPKVKKKPTKPKVRELIKAANEHKASESDSEDNMEVSTMLL
jgi:hypothetical protein